MFDPILIPALRDYCQENSLRLSLGKPVSLPRMTRFVLVTADNDDPSTISAWQERHGLENYVGFAWDATNGTEAGHLYGFTAEQDVLAVEFKLLFGGGE